MNIFRQYMATRSKHWKATKRLTFIMVLLWIVFGILFPYVFTDYLNQYRMAGFQLGFWMTMQGSIITFVVLLFVYSILMDRIDKKYKRKS